MLNQAAVINMLRAQCRHEWPIERTVACLGRGSSLLCPLLLGRCPSPLDVDTLSFLGLAGLVERVVAGYGVLHQVGAVVGVDGGGLDGLGSAGGAIAAVLVQRDNHAAGSGCAVRLGVPGEWTTRQQRASMEG